MLVRVEYKFIFLLLLDLFVELVKWLFYLHQSHSDYILCMSETFWLVADSTTVFNIITSAYQLATYTQCYWVNFSKI